MKDFIEYLVKQIVSKPEEVKVEEMKNGDILEIRISVDDSDMGLVIGKEGRIIKSIRSLSKAKAIKENIRTNIELIDKKAYNA